MNTSTYLYFLLALPCKLIFNVTYKVYTIVSRDIYILLFRSLFRILYTKKFLVYSFSIHYLLNM